MRDEDRQDIVCALSGAQSIAQALGHMAFDGEPVADMSAALWALAEMLGDLSDRLSRARVQGGEGVAHV
ncbi:hypothetical protein [Pararhodospirillum photometricum]|uniref:Uncharacterized protein n=1 Tax=Pararhodospirillum photometricum DSM 122 TaxID=1150469 RepID=H6SPF2_PARPM|nr:hypothetical protein [Pararhodospirillum photometricum]CCG09477.1 unnamed protein product [Pararhodospirillum photometricum DSM 122]